MITIVLLSIVVVLVFIQIESLGFRPKKYPPGPKSWPFFGNVSMLRKLSRKYGGQHLAFLELSKRYKSSLIALRLGGCNTIVVSGKEDIQTVLLSEEYDGRPWNEFIKLRNMGMRKGITMNDGPEWREIRNWFVRTFRIIGFSRREMTEYVEQELVGVLDHLKDGGVKQMKPVIVPVVINVLWIFATGKPFANNEKLQFFIELMERRARAFDMSGGLLSAFPWIRHIAPEYSGYNILMTLNKEFKNMLMDTIEEHKKKFVPGSESDLIDMFLNEMYSGKGPDAGFNEDQLLMILLDILIAGLNITAATFDFLFLNMAMNQDAQRRLHEELDNVIGKDRSPNFNDRAKLPYLEAVLLESQRLTPVVPIIGPRRVLRDTKIQDFIIPKNTSVLINIFSINVDEEIYPNHKCFQPERFIKDGKFWHDDNMLNFGRGKRRCPGESLAKSALFLLFAGVMQKFELHPVPGGKPLLLEILPGLTLSPKPYEVLLVPRNTRRCEISPGEM